MAEDTLTHTQKREQIQILFAAITAGTCMVMSAALPFLVTYLILSGSALALYLSLKKWTDRAKLGEPASTLVLHDPLEDPSKTMAGLGIGLVGLILMQMNPLSQIIICTAFGGALAGFFIHFCILDPQLCVDKALRTACQKGELDKVKALLALKASPFSPDNEGNNAFHLAMQSHQAEALLHELYAATLPPPLSLKEIAASTKQLFNEDISQKWNEWSVQIKKCIKENTKDNRILCYEASFNLINAYYVPLQHIVNTTAQYLIEQLAYPRDIHATNKAGQKPTDILANTSHLNETKAKLQKILDELAKKQNTQEPEEIPSTAAPIRFSKARTQENENKNDSKPRPITLFKKN